MAEKVKKTGKKKTGKKREKLNIPNGIAHILATFNNTIITITDLEGNLLVAVQCRRCRFQRIAQRHSVCCAAGGDHRGRRREGVRHALIAGLSQRARRRPRVRRSSAAGCGNRGEIHPRYHPDSP